MTSSAQVEAPGRTSPALLAGLTVAALVGAADTAIFIATDPQTALKTSGPEAHFDPSSLTVARARELMERYGLH